jgi:hypothetical protein
MGGLEGLSVAEVLQLVESGKLSTDAALELERKGRNRKSLIAKLEALVAPEEHDQEALNDPEEQPEPQDILDATSDDAREPERLESETVRVVFLHNVKHNTTLYRAGQRAEVARADFEILTAANAVVVEE